MHEKAYEQYRLRHHLDSLIKCCLCQVSCIATILMTTKSLQSITKSMKISRLIIVGNIVALNRPPRTCWYVHAHIAVDVNTATTRARSRPPPPLPRPPGYMYNVFDGAVRLDKGINI